MNKFNVENYKRFVGIDLGRMAIVAGVIRENIVTEKKEDKKLFIKSKTFRWISKEMWRRKILTTKMKKINRIYKRQIVNSKKYKEINLNNPKDFKRITEYRIQFYCLMKEMKHRKFQLLLKENQFINIRKHLDRLINFMIGDVKSKPCLLAI